MSAERPAENENVAESVPTGENTSLDFLDNMIAEAATTESSAAEKAAVAKALAEAQSSYDFDGPEANRRGFN